MTKKIEDRLKEIPVLNWLIIATEKIKIPGMQGMSLYDILEISLV